MEISSAIPRVISVADQALAQDQSSQAGIGWEFWLATSSILLGFFLHQWAKRRGEIISVHVEVIQDISKSLAKADTAIYRTFHDSKSLMANPQEIAKIIDAQAEFAQSVKHVKTLKHFGLVHWNTKISDDTFKYADQMLANAYNALNKSYAASNENDDKIKNNRIYESSKSLIESYSDFIELKGCASEIWDSLHVSGHAYSTWSSYIWITCCVPFRFTQKAVKFVLESPVVAKSIKIAQDHAIEVIIKSV